MSRRRPTDLRQPDLLAWAPPPIPAFLRAAAAPERVATPPARRESVRWTIRDDPRQVSIFDLVPTPQAAFLPFPLPDPEGYEDWAHRVWVAVMRQAWLDAAWVDPRQGQPLSGSRESRRARTERQDARADALGFWVGVVIADEEDCPAEEREVTLGDHEELITLERVCTLLDWPVHRVRRLVLRQLARVSPWHLDAIDRLQASEFAPKQKKFVENRDCSLG